MAIEIHETGKSVGHLRADAKKLSREQGIPLHQALDEVVLEFYRQGPETYDIAWYLGKNIWSKFRESVWTLRPDGILERTEGKPAPEYYEGVKLPSFYPNGQRFELDIDCLRSGVAVPLKDRDEVPILELPLDMPVGLYDLTTRLYRSVENGVLVQRRRINDSEGCFDRAPQWPTRCNCCLRHEQHFDSPAHRVSYNKALREGSLKHMAEWVVGCFGRAGWRGSAEGYPAVTSTPEAEAIVASVDRIDDEIAAICDADDLLNGRDPEQRYARKARAQLKEAQRTGVKLPEMTIRMASRIADV